jgi:hypothetical protein
VKARNSRFFTRNFGVKARNARFFMRNFGVKALTFNKIT